MTGRHNETILGYADNTDISNFLLLDIDSSFDTQIDTWIATAEKFVNNYLGYTTASGILMEEITAEVDDKVTVDSDLNLIIFPRKTPIVSISSLQLVKGAETLTFTLTDGDGNAKYNIPTSGGFFSYPDRELSMTGTSIINSFADLRSADFFTKINYIAGYSEVPADIRQATVNLVSDIVMRHTNKEGLEMITQGRITKKWQTGRGGKSDFHHDAVELLKPYRLSARWV